MDNAQRRRETDAERVARAPNVLEAYARDIDRHGKPLDSGLAPLLRFVADQLRQGKDRASTLENALRFYAEREWANGYPGGVYVDRAHTTLDFGDVARSALGRQ